MNESRQDLQDRIRDFFLNETLSKRFTYNMDGKKSDNALGLLKEHISYAAKWLKNHSYYTICMKSHEEAVGIFRICSEEIEGIECYDKLKIRRLLYIKLKGRKYMICPDAFRAWSQQDFDKHGIE